MKRTIYLILMITLFFPQIVLCSDWINENIRLTINCKFTEALEFLHHRLMEQSDDYRIYFYYAATLNSRMAHFENFQDEQEFNQYIEKTIRLIEPQLKNENLDDSLHAKLLFYLGSAYGYRSYFEGKKGDWYSSLSNGLEAKSLLNQAIEMDSTLYEAYLGIGTYKYWVSSKIGFALWLPFIPDDRDEGIRMIKKSIEKNSPTKFMAMHQLIYILLDYGKYDDAVFYAEKIVEKYPDSQFMWWANAHTYYKMRDYNKAIYAYKRLLDLIELDPNHHSGHLIKCNLKLAQLYFELENYGLCIKYCQLILNNEYGSELMEKYEDEFEDAEEYLRKSEEQIRTSTLQEEK